MGRTLDSSCIACQPFTWTRRACAEHVECGRTARRVGKLASIGARFHQFRYRDSVHHESLVTEPVAKVAGTQPWSCVSVVR